MKKDKNTFYSNKILKCLLLGKTLTILQIADCVGLSEKTVRTKIDHVNVWLEANDLGRIQKKQGTGIWLEAEKDQKERLKENLQMNMEMDVLENLENRNKQLMGKLLKISPNQIVTIQQLADGLYLSAPTVSNLLKGVTPWFEKRNLKIISVRNKGIRLDGDEYTYRSAIKDYMMYVMPEVMEALLGTYAACADIYRIRRIIVEAENAWRIQLADTSFNMVWIMACLSVARNYVGGEHKFKENQEDDIQHYVEYSFAESIYQRLEKEYQITISNNDVMLMSIMLLSAMRLGNYSDINDEDCTRQYDQNLSIFVKMIIETIDTVLDVDLSQDKTLYESLLIHMRSAIFRMKYSTNPTESLSKYVKNEYKQTFLATWSTSNLFEEYYDVQVTEDELAGIALYIQAALIRSKKDEPLIGVLVTPRGMASSQLIVELIKYNLPEITQIKTVSNHDFRLSNYPEADVIISAVELNMNDSRIVYIGNGVSEQIVEMVREKIKEITGTRVRSKFRFDNLCHELFEVDLLLLHPSAENKDELITLMVKKLEEKGDVTKNYLDTVFDREKATTTSIGRGIAIPHGNMMEINKSKIVVAILDHPIEWHGDPVDVVFLLAIKMTTKFEINRTKQFYKDFLQLTDYGENLETMKKKHSALEIYQYFIG